MIFYLEYLINNNKNSDERRKTYIKKYTTKTLTKYNCGLLMIISIPYFQKSLHGPFLLYE
jgi:hypothetical protein